MLISRTAVIAVAFATLAAAGCSTSRFSSADQQPAPLPAAPSGKVSSTQLPPPAAPAPATAFPTAPEQQVAALPPPDANAPDLTTGSVAGVWNASVSGQSCKMATSLTKLGANNRAAPLRCAPPIDGVKSWNVAGKQLTLYDESGGTLARLYSSGAEKFDGQTTSGVPISLTR